MRRPITESGSVRLVVGADLPERADLVTLPAVQLAIDRLSSTCGYVLIDAPAGGTQTSALAAMKHGDIVAIGAVVTAGIPRFVGRSRNTPPTVRKVRLAKHTILADFSGAGH